jgi:uncharacterized membrane protein
MGDDDKRREMRFSLWGWILFVVCAIFFIASSLRGRDVLGFIGSVVFLAACFVFLYPLARRNDRDQGT